MAYCTNCGQALQDGAKFCVNCGKAVANEHQTQSTYSGELHKCPNCGESLSSFMAECPICGYELRGTQVSTSIQQFTHSLEHIENEEQRANLVRSFPIPNTKEDIFEYMILASTNIVGEPHTIVFDAWVAKFEQCYQKAKLVFATDSDFEKIQDIYNRTSKSIVKEKAIHGAKTAGNVVSRYFAMMPNPIFGVVVIFLVVFAVIRLFRGQFAGIDIIFAALVLWATYKITNKKDKTK